MYQINEIRNKILNGDVLSHLKNLPDESIDCIITSPPYWSLRIYGNDEVIWDGDSECNHEWNELAYQIGHKAGNKDKSLWFDGKPRNNIRESNLARTNTSNLCKKCNAWKGSLGLEPDFNLYISHLLQITKELKRVLKKTGTMFWNHGDTYSNSNWLGDKPNKFQKQQIAPATSGRGAQPNYPNKSLCFLPYRLAQRMIDEQNWILRNVIIWHKTNAMPQSTKDRFNVDFENVFFFVKSKRYYFEPQFEDVKSETIIRNKYGEDGNGKGIYATGRKKGPGSFATETLNGLKRNMRCVWSIPTKSKDFDGEHYASFPERLIEPIIIAGCPEFICDKCGKAKEKIIKTEYEEAGKNNNALKRDKNIKNIDIGARPYDIRMIAHRKQEGYTNCGCGEKFSHGIVLDPFMGSGTTGVVALKLNRSFLGIEINPNYIRISENRLKPLMEQQKL